MSAVIIFVAVLFVAYANGANDNFKGVATLYGSGTASYRVSLAWTTVFSFLGAVASVLLAMTLVKRFSGQGLVPNDIVHTYPFVVAVALGTGLTVMLASRVGMPVSTTHAITGGLIGVGIAAAGGQVGFSTPGAASWFGLPVSTTHVSVGALLGIGAKTGAGNRRVIGQIFMAWLLTLPAGALVGALVYLLITQLF